MPDLPDGYIPDQSTTPPMPAGYVPDKQPAMPPPPGYQPDQQAAAQPVDWRQSAAADIQRRGLHPLDPGGLSTMLSIYDAHRMAYGNDQERALPDLGTQMRMQNAYQQQHAQQMENAGHGQLASAAIETLHPAAGLFARGEQALAPVADFLFDSADPEVGNRMRANAQQLLNVRGNSDTAGGVAGGLVGNLPIMANPLVAAASAGSDAYNQSSQAQQLNPNISNSDVALDTGGQAVLAAATSYLLGGNMQGGAAKSLQGQLAKYVPGLVAKYGARGAVGALIGLAQTPAANTITKATINPDQNLMEGGLRNTLLGAGAEVGLTALSPNEPAAQQPGQPLDIGPYLHDQQPPVEPTFQKPTAADHEQIRQAGNALGDTLRQQTGQNDLAALKPQFSDLSATQDQQIAEHPNASAAPVDNGPDLSGPFSSRDMLKYIDLKSQDADLEGARQLLGGKQYQLKDMPVTDLTTRGSTDLKQGDIDKYTAMPAESSPPVVADSDGQIIDGNRRLAAAQARGDETIKAYVPVDEAKTASQDNAGATIPPSAESPPVAEAGPSKVQSAFSKARQLVSDEAGGTEALSKFNERTVQPAVEDTLDRASKTWKNVNRFLGTGIGETDAEKRVGGKIVQSLGQQDLDRIRTEQAFKPFRDTVGNYSDPQKVQWVEDVENGQPSADKATQPAADLLRKLNTKNIADASAVGLDTSNWSEDWAGRLAEWPEQKGGTGTGSIAGSEGFLKSRKIDTFGEFKDAVEATGGKLKYDNPIDMAIAKQAEVRKSIEARKIVNDEMTAGTIKKLEPGDKLPAGYDYLDDRLARKYTKAKLWIDPETNKPRMVPADRLIAPEGVAAKFNQFIAPGIEPTLPIWKKVVQVAKGSAALNFALSAWHIPTATFRNAGVSLGHALENMHNGEWDLAAKNLMRATPWEQARFGSRIREQAKNAAIDPALEPTVQAIANAGQRFGVKSILDKTRFQTAKESFAAGDPITGAMQFVGAIGHGVTDPIMEKFLPNLKAGAMGARAEMELQRSGGNGDSIKESMSKASANIDNVMGQVVRQNQFQHRVVTDVMDGIFAAPKFLEGDIRQAGAFARDTAQGLADLARGKKPTVTPTMYTAMGHVIVQATLGAAAQIAYTTATTGKPQMPTSLKDYFYPKTGRKNADGSDERITTPGPLSIYASVAREGTKAVTNRVLPLWRAIDEVAKNSDYRNVQIRSGGAVQQTEQSAVHIGKSLVPYAGQSFTEKPTGGTMSPDLKVAGFMGVRKAPASVSRSNATQTVHDIMSERPHPAETPEQADRLQKVSDLATAARTNKEGWRSDMRDALKSGAITQEDVGTITKRATEKQDLPTLVRTSDLSTDEVMKVWDAATDDEKQQIRRVVMNKIQNSRSTSAEQKRAAAARIRE